MSKKTKAKRLAFTVRIEKRTWDAYTKQVGKTFPNSAKHWSRSDLAEVAVSIATANIKNDSVPDHNSAAAAH